MTETTEATTVTTDGRAGPPGHGLARGCPGATCPSSTWTSACSTWPARGRGVQPVADAKAFPEGSTSPWWRAVANADHLALIQTVRARTRVLVSLGDCAVTGNVTALRNLVPLDRVLRTAYVERATVASGVPSRRARPRAASAVARVEPLHWVVAVDAYLLAAALGRPDLGGPPGPAGGAPARGRRHAPRFG